MKEILSDADWHQLVWDCSFNSLGTIENKTPRELLSDTDNRATLVKLMLEVIRVGKKLNIDFPDNFVNYNLKTSYEFTDKPSLLQQIEKGEKPDFEVFNGYIINLAKEHKVRVTENESVYSRLKGLING